MMYFFFVVAVVAQCATSTSSLEYILNPLNSPSSIVKDGVFKSYDGQQYIESVVKNTSCKCGWSYDSPTPRIIGGKNFTPNMYPFLANIALYRQYVLLDVFCGATVISQNHVLTAAHCIAGKNLDELFVLLGAHNIEEMVPKPTMVKVQQTINHPEDDISLVVLSKTITYNEIIGPACLPNLNLDVTGQSIKVLGWGRVSKNGEMSPVPKELSTPVIKINQCKKDWQLYRNVSEQSEICTYTKNQKPYKGDDGGPAVWMDPETQRYTLVGVEIKSCPVYEYLPTIYVKVEAFISWLKQQIADTKPSDICQKVE